MRSEKPKIELTPEMIEAMKESLDRELELKQLLDTGWPPPLDAIQEFFEDLYNTIVGLVNEIVDAITNTFPEMFSNIYSGMTDYLNSVFGAVFGEAWEEASYYEYPWNYLLLPFTIFKYGLNDYVVQPVTNFIADGFNAFSESLGNLIEPIIDPFTNFLNTYINFINMFWDNILEAITLSFPNVFTDFVFDFQYPNIMSFVNTIVSSLEGFTDIVQSSYEDYVNAWLEYAINVKEKIEGGKIDEALAESSTLVNKATLLAIEIDKLNKSFMGSGIRAQALEMFLDGVFNPGSGLIPLLSPIMDAFINKPATYWANAQARTTIPSIDRIRRYYFHDKMTEDYAKMLLSWYGLRDEYIEWEMDTWHIVPSVDMIKTWYLREYIDDATVDLLLKRHGYREGHIAYIKESWWEIPGIRDLITFVVREVITPDDFYAWAKKQGLSEYWAKNYWEAHWVLPSFENIRDAFWRGIISEEEFKKYIVWHDYKPEPRPGISKSDQEIMLELSYDLPGKIDVRWMLRWGIIDRETAKELLKMKGLHPDWIDRVAEAEYLNQLLDERTRVKSEAYASFRDGLMNEDVLREILHNARFLDDEIDYLVNAANLVRERKLKDIVLEVYDDLLEKGYITRDVYVNELVNHGFDSDYVNARADNILLRYENITKKQLTRDERTALANLYMKLYKQGFLSEDDLRARLEEQELTPDEIDKRVERAKEEYSTEITDLWIDYYKELFKHGLIDADTFKTSLINLGMSEEKADAMVEYYSVKYQYIDQVELTRDERKSLANTLLKLYKYGVIPSDELATRLADLGFTDDEINFMLERANREYDYSIKDIYLDLLREQLKQGLIDRSTFINNCVDLGFSSDKCEAWAELYYTRYIGIDYYVLTRDERKSLANTLLRLYKYGRYSEDEVRARLSQLGFTDREIDLMMERANIEAEYEQIEYLIKYYDELLRAGAITQDEYISSLTQLGIRQEMAEARALYILRKQIARGMAG